MQQFILIRSPRVRLIVVYWHLCVYVWGYTYYNVKWEWKREDWVRKAQNQIFARNWQSAKTFWWCFQQTPIGHRRDECKLPPVECLSSTLNTIVIALHEYMIMTIKMHPWVNFTRNINILYIKDDFNRKSQRKFKPTLFSTANICS